MQSTLKATLLNKEIGKDILTWRKKSQSLSPSRRLEVRNQQLRRDPGEQLAKFESLMTPLRLIYPSFARVFDLPFFQLSCLSIQFPPFPSNSIWLLITSSRLTSLHGAWHWLRLIMVICFKRKKDFFHLIFLEGKRNFQSPLHCDVTSSISPVFTFD